MAWRNLRCLVVDDEQDFLETISQRLKARKIEVHRGGKTAIRPLNSWMTMTLM